MFTATQQQEYRLRTGRQKNCVCSLSCRGVLNIAGLIEKYGFKRATVKGVARRKVRVAIENGILTRPATCEECGRRVGSRKIHAHHFAGYDAKNALNVQWVCCPCHTKMDIHTKVRGEENTNSKLTAPDILIIRHRLSAGNTLLSIGREFGVCKKTIANIRDQKIWRHVL